MIARIGLLLTAALVILLVLAARQLCVASDAQISSTGVVWGTGFINAAPVSPTPATGRYEDGEDPVDLYGNEVTAAVATYKLDSTGSLYELHSPQTELPRLSAPKS